MWTRFPIFSAQKAPFRWRDSAGRSASGTLSPARFICSGFLMTGGAPAAFSLLPKRVLRRKGSRSVNTGLTAKFRFFGPTALGFQIHFPPKFNNQRFANGNVRNSVLFLPPTGHSEKIGPQPVSAGARERPSYGRDITRPPETAAPPEVAKPRTFKLDQIAPAWPMGRGSPN